jgi:hypothetical protein
MTTTPGHSDVNAIRIPAERVRAFVGVMQTLYGILMILGFKEAFQISYQRLFPTGGSNALPAGTSAAPLFSILVVAVSLTAIAFLGLRFFWVPRTLLRFLDDVTDPNPAFFRTTMIVHLPITLFHGTLFYYICRAFEDMAASTNRDAHPIGSILLADRVIFLVAGLLLMNAVWLCWIARTKRPPITWAMNNFAHVFLILGLWLLVSGYSLSAETFVLTASGVLLANSGIDLWSTAQCYIWMDHDPGAISLRFFGTIAKVGVPLLSLGAALALVGLAYANPKLIGLAGIVIVATSLAAFGVYGLRKKELLPTQLSTS